MSRHRPPKVELALIRHGQTDWNLERRCQGQLDAARLTADGIAQASEMAANLARMSIAALYSSSQTRSIQSAEVIAEALNLPVQTDPRLGEMDQGEWQGMIYPDIERRYAELYRQFMANPLRATPPGGESIRALSRRVNSAIDEIAERHAGQRVAIVSHEIPMAALRCWAARQELSALWQYAPANGEIIRLAWPVERLGWLAMLKEWLHFRWWFAGSG
jgi:broad specificity phosphatase PhoE